MTPRIRLIAGSIGGPAGLSRAVELNAKLAKKSFRIIWRRKMQILLEKLIQATPRWTGAASGEATGVEVPTWHKAYGFTIGNSPGDSGWQLKETEDSSNRIIVLIINPMWNRYLKYLEYGEWSKHMGFTRQAFQSFKDGEGL